MVDRITKFLKKLNSKELAEVNVCIEHLLVRDYHGYHIRKLKGHDHLYRIRKGRIRIVYYDDGINEIHILKIAFRDERTYCGID